MATVRSARGGNTSGLVTTCRPRASVATQVSLKLSEALGFSAAAASGFGAAPKINAAKAVTKARGENPPKVQRRERREAGEGSRRGQNFTPVGRSFDRPSWVVGEGAGLCMVGR